MKVTKLGFIAFTMTVLVSGLFPAAHAQTSVTPAEARTIAKEAYVYGFPMVDSYRILYAYFQDRNNPEFKAPWNQLRNIPRVYTPQDTAIQTPNSDTPYSMIGMDLRAEPLVLTVPKIEKERYFSIQFIDSYSNTCSMSRQGNCWEARSVRRPIERMKDRSR